MEWFVAIIFAIFIGGLIWVTVEAVKHANRPKTPDKTNAVDARIFRG
ncbi:MAG: hypothetical protein ACREYF_22490 [Gammaproteobacteria bacterium]